MEYVLGFRFDLEKKNVVLIEKLKPEWQKGSYNGIGGKVEEFDKVGGKDYKIAAMVREFREETGIETFAHSWTHHVTMTNKDWTVFVFRSTGDISTAQTMEKEEVVIGSVDDIPTKVLHNLKWLIPLLLDDQVKKPISIQYC